MLGLPAEAEVPRTSFSVRFFSFLCPNPEDSRSKESARRRAKGLALRADEKRPSLPPLRSAGCRM